MNNLFIMGRVTKDAEIRVSTTGTKVARFSIAYDSYVGKEKKTEFYDFTAFGNGADFVEKFVKKGKRFAITGHLSKDVYTKPDGTNVNTIKLIADKVDFADGNEAVNEAPINVPVQQNFDADGNLPF